MFETSSDVWLKTPQAALALGCSQGHLKRCRVSHGGFLKPHIHYSLGSSCTAPITWNVTQVRRAFHLRGLKVRTGEQVLDQLLADSRREQVEA